MADCSSRQNLATPWLWVAMHPPTSGQSVGLQSQEANARCIIVLRLLYEPTTPAGASTACGSQVMNNFLATRLGVPFIDSQSGLESVLAVVHNTESVSIWV
ncbi:hypothetical protein ACJQWK_03332 [Exserohilum turcicum]